METRVIQMDLGYTWFREFDVCEMKSATEYVNFVCSTLNFLISLHLREYLENIVIR